MTDSGAPRTAPAGDSPPALAEQLLQVWDEAPEAIVVLDSAWRYRYLNRAAHELLRLPDDVVGSDSREVHPEASSSSFGAAYREVMTSGIAQTVEHHYKPLDTYLRAIIRPWAGGIVIILLDVTAQRRPEARLKHNLHVYQQVLDHTIQSITLRDLEGRFLLVNKAAAERFGRLAEEIIGRLSDDVFPPGVVSELREVDSLVLSSGQAQENVAARTLHPERKVIAHVYPVFEPDGTMIGIASSAVDVTELAAIDARLAASDLRFRRAFGSTSLGILLVRLDGRILEANAAASRILGYSRAQLFDMDALDLLPPDRRGAGNGCRQVAVKDDVGYEIEEQMLRSDGSTVPVLVTVNPLDDPAGDGRILSVMLRDLTDLRELQQQLLASARMEAVGQLAAGIAHDANNILAGVTGYSELLASEVGDRPNAVRYLAGISRSVARAGDMVDRLLSFSRGEVLQPTVLDLADVVRDMSELLERLLPAGITLDVALDSAPALADASQVRQVVLNLVVNARNALVDSGTIRIRTGRRQPAAAEAVSVLTVSDDGPGMPDEVARHCFEPFYTTRADHGGTGVGLSSALRIARENNGDLQLETALGVGTTFDLVLPAVAVPPRDAAAPERHSAAGSTILVVDDNPAIHDLVGRTLSGAGYRVTLAADAEQALAAAGTADLVLSDVQMPGMTGLELAARLSEEQPRLPVVLMSGNLTSKADPRWRLLVKPFTDEELLAAVATALATST